MATPFMEIMSNLNSRIWPLPGGDRRGASGANAGRSSIRTIGGRRGTRTK